MICEVFNRTVVSPGPRAAPTTTAFVLVTVTVLAIPVLSERPLWHSTTAICVIAMMVVFAAVFANRSSIKEEDR